MSTKPGLSVVMPVLNAARHIDAQLAALVAQEFVGDWELIVADNGSTDGTQSRVAAWEGRLPLTLVDASRRKGSGAARNVGVGEAKGSALLFCDADDVVGPRWIPSHASALEEVCLSAGAVVFFDRQPPSTLTAPPPRPPTQLGWLPYAQSANCAVRRAAFDAIGGFPEENTHAEDVEFSWRIQLAGFAFGYTPEAVVFKRRRETAREQLLQGYRYGKCDVYLYKRYRPRGLTKPNTSSVLRTYGGLLARIPALMSPAVRDRWLRQVGRRSGRLIASIKARTFLP